MVKTVRTFLRRLGAMLCIALLFIFTQAAVASTVGSIQHGIVGQHDHHHMLFADISLDAAQHDADHHDHDGDGQFHDEDSAGEHGPGHHHHHGDLGSSSFLLASPPGGLLLTGHEQVVPVPGRLLTDTRHSLPDRPPRASLPSA